MIVPGEVALSKNKMSVPYIKSLSFILLGSSGLLLTRLGPEFAHGGCIYGHHSI